MLHYRWNNYLVSGTLVGDRISVEVMPSNVLTKGEMQVDLESVEKGFIGDIITGMLVSGLGVEHKNLRKIHKFYDYLSDCLTEAERARVDRRVLDQQRVFLVKEVSIRQGKREERLTLRLKLPQMRLQGVQIEQQGQLGSQFVLRLKQTYLGYNSILLRCNSIMMGELEYFKKRDIIYQQRIKELQLSISHKVQKEFIQLKKSLERKFKYLIKDFKGQIKGKIGGINSPAPTSNVSSDPVKDQNVDIYEEQKDNQTKHEEEIALMHNQFKHGQIKSKVMSIPIQFDAQNPGYFLYEVSQRTIAKKGGFDYPLMLLRHVIPDKGAHAVVLKYLKKQKKFKGCCFQVGIIDINNKDMLHSSKWKNYVKIKFSLLSVITDVEGRAVHRKYNKMKKLNPGEAIILKVNREVGQVEWQMSNGVNVSSPIPAQLLKLDLVPFVGLYTVGDIVQFMVYPQN